MTTIDPDYDVPWYRTPLPKEQLQALNSRSDGRGLLQAGGHLALVLASGAACVLAWQAAAWGWLAAALYLHGTFCAFMINGVHEMVHGTVFRSRWLNTVFMHTFAFIGWINHRQFWASHSEHHKFTLHDPHDQEVVLPITYSLKGFLKSVLIDPGSMRFHIRHNWRLARGRIDGEWNQHTLADEQVRRRVQNWSRCILVGHATIAAVSLALGWWIVPVVVSLTPLYGRGLLFLLNNTQHVGLKDHVNDFRLNCRTIEVNPFFRFLYWHMNYHIEHHMYAAVPCYRLRDLHRAIAHELPPTPQGLVQAWWQISTILYRQQQEPGYQFQPVLPGAEHAENRSAHDRRPQPAGAPTPARPATAGRTETARVWQCMICGFIYDEAKGLPQEGIAPGTAWDDIPDDWHCPDCGVSKAEFEMKLVQRAVVETTASQPHGEPIVIVGSGMAGYQVATEYRARGGERPLVLLTRDEGEHYAKPMLSNALAKGRGLDDLVSESPAVIAERLRLDIRTGVTVRAIDRERRLLDTSEGDVSYADLVLALGADQIRIPIAGDGAEQIHRVNDLASYRALRAALGARGRVVILGGGLIGCEFANDLVASGHQVHVIDRAERPLSALLPAPAGDELAAALAADGVHWHLGTSLERVDRGADGLVCQLADGSTCTADLVLSAIGLRPRTELAAAAGLQVDRGICVDEHLRTADPHISALGDCAQVDGVWRPYVAPIRHGACAIAASLTGEPAMADFPPMPVVIKTPSLPVAVLPPPADAAIDWQVEEADGGRLLRAIDAEGRMQGFVCTGSCVDRQAGLVAELGKEASAEPV